METSWINIGVGLAVGVLALVIGVWFLKYMWQKIGFSWILAYPLFAMILWGVGSIVITVAYAFFPAWFSR